MPRHVIPRFRTIRLGWRRSAVAPAATIAPGRHELPCPDARPGERARKMERHPRCLSRQPLARVAQADLRYQFSERFERQRRVEVAGQPRIGVGDRKGG
jgi:hypothetical protein